MRKRGLAWPVLTSLRRNYISPPNIPPPRSIVPFAHTRSAGFHINAPGSAGTELEASDTVTVVSKSEEVVIAIGGNTGDRVKNFQTALEFLRGSGIRVTGHGCLYESAPAYVTDQPLFLNSSLKATTSLEPHALLDVLKKIERQLGRIEGGIRYGPRPVDLDIIFYGLSTVNTDTLQIPHPRLAERSFVLAPVVDLLGQEAVESSPSHWSAHSFLQGGLLKVWRDIGGEESVGKEGLRRVTPIGGKLWDWSQKTHIMGILNVTPDSFSDGGLYTSVKDALSRVRNMAAEGADFIDIGGQSTRPGSRRLTTEEEMARILPILDAVAIAPDMPDLCLSVDTFDSKVAEEAVARGVHFVNDVSAGTLDSNMWETVAKLGVPYVAMHMRGDPRVMLDPSHTEYASVPSDVASELAVSLERAELAGIPSWRMIIDPGLGFSKTTEQNVELMKKLGTFREELSWRRSKAVANGPILLGPSRKRFLGKLCGHAQGKDRDYATTAATALGVAAGADIIRAHNVRAVHDAIKVADAIHKMKF